jgi:hypothetical protein
MECASKVLFLALKEIFLFANMFKLAVGSTQAPSYWGERLLSLGVSSFRKKLTTLI